MKIKQRLRTLGVIAIWTGMAVFILAAYRFHWSWTGFNKPLWDWMQLLIVPVALAFVAKQFNRIERKNEEEIASDHQKETTLQVYLDRMSELLLKDDLLASKPKDKVRNVARARTLTTLRQLDAERKGNVLRFLYESGLIDFDAAVPDESIINLRGADLSSINLDRTALRKVNLSNANLFKANLRGVDLFLADLGGADLREADLSEADLRGADLRKADLRGAKLRKADLSSAKLTRACLSGSDLSRANLSGADLSGTNLSWADLSQANLYRAYLRRAKLNNADLREADLNKTYLSGASFKKAKLSPEQTSTLTSTLSKVNEQVIDNPHSIV